VTADNDIVVISVMTDARLTVFKIQCTLKYTFINTLCSFLAAPRVDVD